MTNLNLLLRGEQPFGLPPKKEWNKHSLTMPEELWLQVCAISTRLGTVSPSEVACYALHGLLLSRPRKVARADFGHGPAGEQAYKEYNIAKGRLGRQIVANAHIFPDVWRPVPGREPLEKQRRIGVAPSNLPAGSGGVELFAIQPPTEAQPAPVVRAVVLAVKTTTSSADSVQWNVPEGGMETALAAQKAGLHILLIRVLLAEDPPTDIVTGEGMLRAVRAAICIPAQYRLDWWLLSWPTVEIAPQDGMSGRRRFLISVREEKGDRSP